MNDEFDTMPAEDVKKLFESEGMKKVFALREAEKEAREKAGIYGKAGYVEFPCPHCGGVCISDFYPTNGELHGGMGCPKCKIGIRI